MAYLTYPLNNIEYDAADAETYLCTRTSGVFANEDFSATITGADANITIGEGIAWLNNAKYAGKVFKSDADVMLTLPAADSSLPRYDGVYIQYLTATNATSIVYRSGTAASSPEIPAPIRTLTQYELLLYAVYRPAGSAIITAANLTDKRFDETVCGIMRDGVTRLDTTVMQNQFMAFLEAIRQALVDIEAGESSMQKVIYDPQNKTRDIFLYTDDAIAAHDADANAHSQKFQQIFDNYQLAPTKATSLPSSGTVLTADREYRVSGSVGTYTFNFPTSGDVYVKFTTSGSRKLDIYITACREVKRIRLTSRQAVMYMSSLRLREVRILLFLRAQNT